MTETDRAVWGRLIATRRDQLDLTQEKLAEVAKVSEKTVYNVESGEVVPRSKTLRKLKDALGLPDDIRLANRFVRAAGKADSSIEDDLTITELDAGRISRKQLMEFAQLLAEALDAGEAGQEFRGSLSGWTEEQIDSLDRIVRTLLPNPQWQPGNVSDRHGRLRAVASTETRIEGAGEFDDTHAE